MKKKKNVIEPNYLEKIPQRNDALNWKTDDGNRVVLLIENTGFFNRVAQKFIKKPPVTYVHLDDMGSFVWPLIDGKRNIIELGKVVDEHFGDKAKPLYERLAKFFQILDSYKFIKWK
ncbi:MAG: PqqD family protein [Clostridia bacterium]|nr:PqqD family protein [Clostridia bacterium]